MRVTTDIMADFWTTPTILWAACSLIVLVIILVIVATMIALHFRGIGAPAKDQQYILAASDQWVRIICHLRPHIPEFMRQWRKK
jgi:hypothetical protein